ncbi:MAG TPA: hypothetical protein VMR45_04125 [Patescibacteria group bacterium]|jgi:hypothetical protein|nr:hypothetical protein [Patescibacteria group bacterium]
MWNKVVNFALILPVMAVTNPDISPLPKVEPNSATITVVLNIVYAITGSIAFLVLTIAGLRYVVSRGAPQEVAKAKNAIIYALVGLVITIVAASITNFVVGAL